MDILNKIQTELNAPKNQFNKFGKYNYRSCEDVLEGLKPLLKKYECSVILTDDLVLITNISFALRSSKKFTYAVLLKIDITYLLS